MIGETMAQAINRIASESGAGTATTIAIIMMVIFEAIKLLEIWIIAKVIFKAIKKDLLEEIKEIIRSEKWYSEHK